MILLKYGGSGAVKPAPLGGTTPNTARSKPPSHYVGVVYYVTTTTSYYFFLWRFFL